MANLMKLYMGVSKQLRIPNTCSSLMQVQRIPQRHYSQPSEVTQKGVNTTEGVILSESCIKRLKDIAEPGSFLRVLVEGGGCSGFQYKFELDSNVSSEDRIFEKDGAKVVVDEDSLEYIKGSTITFTEELIRSSFSIESNPMADGGCSCGASFSFKL